MKTNYKDLPTIGETIHEEIELTHYLMNSLANYVGSKPVDRRVLIASISQICKLVFTNQTPFNIKEQCEEIDMFCEFLKSHALRDAVRS